MKISKAILYSLVLLLAGCSAESHYNKAMSLLENDEVDAAVEHLLKAIEKGSADAQYQLGKLYDEGKKVEPDRKKAFELFRAAAEAGNVQAQTTIGAFYLFTDNAIIKDRDKGLFWLQKASNARDPQASLALIKYYGEAIDEAKHERRLAAEKREVDFDESSMSKTERELFEKIKVLAEKVALSDADKEGFASMALAYMYSDGLTVPKDLKKGIEYAEFAANKNNKGAWRYLGYMFSDSDNGFVNYSKATKYLKKLLAVNQAERPSRLAHIYFKLAKIYLNESYDGYDATQAVEYMELAEKEENAEYNSDLHRTLGMCYYEGTGVKRNAKLAFKYLELAAEHFDHESALLMGELYYEGKNLPVQMTRIEQLEKAEDFLRNASVSAKDEKTKKDIDAAIKQISEERYDLL